MTDHQMTAEEQQEVKTPTSCDYEKQQEEEEVGNAAEICQEAPMYNLYSSVLAYNLFTLTDGGARTVILLHANRMGFNSIEIALMFSLYEVMGVVTNLMGGFFGSRKGIRQTLLSSCLCQIIGLVALALTPSVFGDLAQVDSSTRLQAFWWIAICQAFNGIGKDLMKLGGKTVPKLVTKQSDDGRLFRLIAWLTGAKNSMKGLGFFMGSLLLWGTTYVAALLIMTGLILVIIPLCLFYIDKSLGIAATKVSVRDIFRKGKNVNLLSLARFFLFGSRDVWFEVAAPLYLAGNPLQWADFLVGAFMAAYTIVYGQFQAFSTNAFKKGKAPRAKDVFICVCVLLCIPGVLGGVLYGAKNSNIATTASLLTGMVIFAVVFAFNSAVHSFMIVKYSNRDKVSMDLGFYYMANAGGRLVGTVSSGFIFYYTQGEFGLSVCLWVSSVFLILGAIVSYFLDECPN